MPLRHEFKLAVDIVSDEIKSLEEKILSGHLPADTVNEQLVVYRSAVLSRRRLMEVRQKITAAAEKEDGIEVEGQSLSEIPENEEKI